MREIDIVKNITKMFGVDAGMKTAKLLFSWDGGEGSGNFGHKGRPGMVGGSGKGEGSGGSEGSTESLPQTETFRKIQRKAEKSKGSFDKFMSSLSADEMMDFMEQREKSGSTESDDAYMERMYKMMTSKSTKQSKENKPVDGKDITKDYEWNGEPYTGTTGQVIDTQIEDVLDKQGFMGVPKVVSSEEFDKIVKEHPEMPILFRSYSAPNEEVLDDYDEQLNGKEWYVDCGVGGAQYGQGMYCAGMYIDPPRKWDDGGAFDDHYPNSYIIGSDGKTYDCESGEPVEDYWMDDGEVYVLSHRDEYGRVHSNMVKVVDASEEDDEDHLGKLFQDMETGELHDLTWLYDNYPSKDDYKMMHCEEVDPEKPFEVDYSDTYEEMRHYRRINEDKMREWNPVAPEGKKLMLVSNNDGFYDKAVYYDNDKQISLSENPPKAGENIIVKGLLAYLDEEGQLHFKTGGATVPVTPSMKYSPVDGVLQKPDVNPQSSTRRMTLDPSAKIIDYADLETLAYDHITKKEKQDIYRDVFDDICERYGVKDDDAKKVFWSDISSDYPDDETYLRYIGKQDKYEEKRGQVFGDFVKESFEKTKALKAERAKVFEKFDDYGALAAALGYDVINAGGHGLSGSYTVILNRSKVIIDEDRVDVYKRA